MAWSLWVDTASHLSFYSFHAYNKYIHFSLCLPIQPQEAPRAAVRVKKHFEEKKYIKK